MFVLRAHPVRGEAHNQRKTTGDVATPARAPLGSTGCAAKSEWINK